MADVKGRKIAVLATDGVEQVELTEPVKALKQAGAQVTVIAPKGGQIQGMNHHDKGDKLPVDAELSGVKPDGFDALVLPGGVANPDTLRTMPPAVAFVKHFVDAGKPIAAICHGPWTLIEAGGVRGKKMTSWPSLRTDLQNAGAQWVDETCVVDGTLVTSRKPDDIPAFNQHMIEVFGGAAQRRAA
jgi:protease I